MVPVPNCYKKFVLGAIFDFHGFQKATVRPPFRQSRRDKRSARNDPGGPSRDPAFHETIVITVPFGPSGSLKSLFAR